MAIKIQFDTDNAAFDDAPASEIGRILRKLADDIEQTGGEPYTVIHDINGNRIGECQILADY